MAKRGDKWKQDWYLKLTPQAKLYYTYFYDNCNHIGIIELSRVMMSAQIGFSNRVSVEEFLPELKEVVSLFKDGNKLWVKSFINENYGVIGVESSIHKTVLKELAKYKDDENCSDDFRSLIHSLSEKIYRVQVGYTYPIINKKKNNIEDNIIKIDFKEEKQKFLNDKIWFENFGSSKHILPDPLNKMIDEFLKDLELKEEFRDCQGLKSYFTNYFNKQKNGNNRRSIENTEVGKSIKLDRA